MPKKRRPDKKKRRPDNWFWPASRDKAVEKQRKKDEATRRARSEREVAAPVGTYVDDDGCEVTKTSDGHVFYNVTDWW